VCVCVCLCVCECVRVCVRAFSNRHDRASHESFRKILLRLRTCMRVRLGVTAWAFNTHMVTTMRAMCDTWMIDFAIITASPQLRTPPFNEHLALPFPPTHVARQTLASMLLCVLKFSHTYGNSSPAPFGTVWCWYSLILVQSRGQGKCIC